MVINLTEIMAESLKDCVVSILIENVKNKVQKFIKNIFFLVSSCFVYIMIRGVETFFEFVRLSCQMKISTQIHAKNVEISTLSNYVPILWLFKLIINHNFYK